MASKDDLEFSSFIAAVAITSDFIPLAAGFLLRLRQLEPQCQILIYTDQESRELLRLAQAINALDVITIRPYDYNYGDWHPILQAKFDVLKYQTTEIIAFLDVDQILYKPISSFIRQFKISSAILAGSPDDEDLLKQYIPGKAPKGIIRGMPAINTGAFLIKPDNTLFNIVQKELPNYSNCSRLPTQAVINGVIHTHDVPLLRLEDDFMAAPFSHHLLNTPRQCSLVHYWTPRPPFMPFSAPRKGEVPYIELKKKFELEFGSAYPELQIKKEFIDQMTLWTEVNKTI